ncbi:MAG: T9SS type A sorting domain-containing protein [Melioribacteraceae bacterium]
MCSPTKYFIFVFIIIHLIFLKNEAQINVIRSVEYKQISSFEENMEISNMKMSSDGTKIIFATGGYTRKVYTINSDESGLKLIYDFTNTGFGPFVDINADGSKIIWCDYTGTGEIFISNSDGSSINKIVALLPNPDPNFADMKPEIPVSPRITADGNTVYFIHNHRDPKGTGVWKVYSDGSNLQQVFNFSNMAIELFGRNVNEFWTTSFNSGFDISANAEAILVGTPFFKIEESDFNNGDLVVYTNGSFYHLGEYAVGNQPFSTNKNGDQFLIFKREHNAELNSDEINVYFVPIVIGSPIKVISGLNIFGTSAMTQMSGDGSIAIVQADNGRLPITFVDRSTSSCFDLVSIDGISINALGGFRFSESSLPSINWNGNKFCFLAHSNPPQIWIGNINLDGSQSELNISEIQFTPDYVLIDGSTTAAFNAHITSAPNAIHTATFDVLKDGLIQFRALYSDWPYNGLLVDNKEFGDTQANDGFFCNNSIHADLPETPIGNYTIRLAAINSTLRQITSVDVEPFSIIDQPNSIEDEENQFSNFNLSQNYPNPFNPNTTIKYSVPSSVMLNSFQHLDNSEIPKQVRDDVAHVTLKVYDILGREIKTLVNVKQKPGNYEVEFNAANLPSGVYYYRLKTDKFNNTKTMILMK